MSQALALPPDWKKLADKWGGKIVKPRYRYSRSSPSVVFRIEPWRVILRACAGSEDIGAQLLYRDDYTEVDYQLAIRDKLWFRLFSTSN